jgi:serine phosphatase RsbU (regulator of sigma subunit)
MKKFIVLCVDDEQIILNSLKAQISSVLAPILVAEIAESGSEGLEVIDELLQEGETVAVIISDYLMPGMKGDEFLIKAHQKLPNAKKILLTGQANIDGITNAVNHADLYRYIAKPWEAQDLEMTISTAFELFLNEKQVLTQNEELKKLNSELADSNQKLEAAVQNLNLLNEELEEKVQARTSELSRKNEQMSASIRYAKRIQTAIFPDLSVLQEYFPECFLLDLPKDVVSGDFFWYEKIDDIWVFALADCTGHGVPGAFMSLIGNELLKRTAFEYKNTPDALLLKLTERIRKMWKHESSNIRDGFDISVVSFDTVNRKIAYAGAKRPLLIFNGDEATFVRGNNLSIESREREINYSFDKHEFVLNDKARFYLFSDGFQDQFGGENHKYSSKNFVEFIKTNQHLPMQAQKEALMNEFLSWKGNLAQTDDIMVFGIDLQNRATI